MRYRALACFDDGSERGDETSAEGVWAETAPAAARKWYWKLTAAERENCLLVIVSAYIKEEPYPWPAYEGPTVAFAPREQWRQVGGPVAPHGKIGEGGEVSFY